MNIKDLALKIDELSSNFKIGNLQEIRKNLKNLKAKPGSKIFNDKTTFDDWAFHYGGRKELQFNIGNEDEGIRYGIAFSLEPSQSLPNIQDLFPKILRLNSLIINQPDLFSNYKMWYWQNGKRSVINNVFEINEQLTKIGTFIFIGKLVDYNNVNVIEILKDFDDLLNIYIEVENENITIGPQNQKSTTGFIFASGRPNLPQSTKYTRTQQQINVNARHSFLQEKLYKKLTSVFGEETVGMEIFLNGKKIDLVLKINNLFTFYEIKTSNSAKQCIREALGQIFEYTYFDGKKYADEIVIAGEYPIDKSTQKYLKFLNSEFNLPISYHQIDINF